MNRNTCNIKEHLGIIFTKNSTWPKEVNIISWYWRPPEYDIRLWFRGHKPSRNGLTLNEEEARTLYRALRGIFEYRY